MGNFTTVPDVVVGQSFPPSLWESAIMNNLNLGVMRQLGDTTLGASAATVAFASIPATFAHLLLVGSARGDQAAGSVTLNARFNSDSGANYLTETLQGAAAAASSSSTGATTAAALAFAIAAASAAASVFSPVWALIPNYASTTPRKEGLSLAFYAGTPTVQLEGFDWSGTAAINNISIFAATGNLVAGTRFTLYGLPA